MRTEDRVVQVDHIGHRWDRGVGAAGSRAVAQRRRAARRHRSHGQRLQLGRLSVWHVCGIKVYDICVASVWQCVALIDRIGIPGSVGQAAPGAGHTSSTS